MESVVSDGRYMVPGDTSEPETHKPVGVIDDGRYVIQGAAKDDVGPDYSVVVDGQYAEAPR